SPQGRGAAAQRGEAERSASPRGRGERRPGKRRNTPHPPPSRQAAPPARRCGPMRKRLALALVCAWSLAARAEVYRCEDPSGAVRFTSDPRGCAKPSVHEPPGSRWVDAPAAPASSSPPPSEVFPPAPSRAWETLTEAPELPDDAERARGLIASVARHYTRARGPVSEVCT